MKYRSVKYSQPSTKRRIFFFVVVTLVIFFWPSIKKGVYTVFEPVTVRFFEVGGNVIGVPHFIQAFFTSHLQREKTLQELKQRVELLENENQLYASRLRELAPLMEAQATSTQATKGEHLLTTITMSSLAQDYTRLYATVIFNKGFRDDVEVGDTVFLRGRVAVCSIKEVYARSSVCSLFSAYGKTTEGVTASSSIVLTLLGRGGHYIASVPRDTPVTVGEQVFLRDDQSFSVGKVVDVIHNNQDTAWHIFVESDYNPVSSSLFYIQKNTK